MIGKREMSLSSEKMCLVNLKVRRGEDRDEGDVFVFVFVCVFVFRKNVLGQFESKKRLGEERREAVSPGADGVQVRTPGHCRGIILALPVALAIVLSSTTSGTRNSTSSSICSSHCTAGATSASYTSYSCAGTSSATIACASSTGAPAVLSGRMHVSCCICRKSWGQQVLPDPRVSP